MSSRFFEQLAQVKSALSGSDSADEKFAHIQPMLRDRDVEREFWNLLDDERWAPVLRRAGVFDSPPQPEVVEGGTRFHPWGASKYLARVASRIPSEVASIFSGMDTENVSVIGDMLDAAAAMPIRDAAALVPAVRRAAAAGILWIHFKDASELCARLATQGDVDLSLSLSAALFSPKGDALKAESGRTDSYWYREGLKKVAPILSTVRAHTFLPMICDWLERLVRLTKSIDADSGDDYSYIWRPAIEEHEQNHDYDLTGAVVGCVREGFEVGIRDGGFPLSSALALLDRHNLTVFARISLHLLAEFGQQEPEVVARTILNRDSLDDHRIVHEYARLVAHQLAHLDVASRLEWYRWVDAGPDMSDFDEHIRERLQREPTDADRSSRADYWRFQKLHWIRDIIEGPHREFYDRMLAQHGVPEMADLNIRISSRWGEQSPRTVDQLSALAFDDVVEQVSTWRQTDGTGPNLGGLLATFGEYVSTNPADFSAKAGAIRGRSAPVVSAYLRQMTVAVKSGRTIAMPAVLELCEWVVSQTADEGWQGVRDEVSDLIETACQAADDNNRPRFDLGSFRAPFWSLLRKLFTDRSTSYIVRDTHADDFRVHDYLDLGMNSPRGKAVEAGLEFARWVALHITTGGGRQDVVPGGIEVIPELAELLEWQLQASNRSLEAMAIVGSRIGVVNWIDPRWLSDNAGRLFELERIEEDPARAFGWAAWNAFLCWVRPHIVFYHAFEDQFRYAVRHAGRVDVDKQDHDQPMFRLGEHLMVLYGRGQLPLTADVLQQFLIAARPAIRRHAIGFVGSSFGHEDVPADIIERFMLLWDSYWADRGKSDAADDPVAVLFGSWIASGEFPEDWTLSRLNDYVEVVPVPEPDHLVMERLATIAFADISKSVRIVDRMVKGDRDGWRMHGWQEPAKAILAKALSTGGAARRDAEQVIDFLGRRGYTAFGALLKS